ncbi:aminodeoxychorismate lyase [Natrialba magadii ATCC 43099]|uniref:Aminodeoxychorismate lyase n=1 Tax=Natrialba magadii (strain ATCC 43099 / DSM 3394 / CCM 3739 / CIP 104546 / IAM 13178 / JCM 8861 / NBRC 102185 / NCIMB 2190 / MS3) TaxID=547559 RepID=D3SZT8_NATMM|nr:aminotransferase class IV [Natrialba magadii]ADD06348.1 aminodeoxychorismate lyase [Natrialba magadii ATCC 43099]ELY31218.1 D-amino-acid transaminase [Natrialba magadii ATCC 43099]
MTNGIDRPDEPTGSTESELHYHVNGDLVPASEATVSIDDRGFRYGDGAFETLRAYGGTLFGWNRHMRRLAETCEALSLDHGLSPDDLHQRIDETLAANDIEDAYVRLSITRGVQPGKLTPQPVDDPTVVVYVKPLPRGGFQGKTVWDRPAVLQSVETRRIPDEALPAGAKTHNYLNGILARTELDQAADEALMCDTDGLVAEGTTSNLFFVRDETLYTPAADGSLLPGITRELVLELAAETDVPVQEGSYELEFVAGADEAFLTNRTWELRPVASLDGTPIGGGPITAQLSGLYDELVERTCYSRTGDWL